ncbi:MAG TPA: TIGR03619 family F420-dependent LLM class oxidoreductase [Acidimicrobiia bacterium]|nr:TIGR03619 family F420-dependent LLM class oxidoreductase [Acidimicrobiia bacterium]
MKLGIVTPVLTLLPRAHAQWEIDAPFAEVVAIVREAERLGYHHVTCSEHVGIPSDVAATRGGRYWDPAVTLGALAASTATLRLATHVVVLGYHHPLALAKRYGTLDHLSGGRLVLGVGVGSLAEEFALLDAPFADRGERADDAMRALRAALAQRTPEYHGPHYDFAGFVIDPCAVQPHVPMWVGGRTARSLRRALELGDGWAPFGLRPAELAAMLTRAGDTDAWTRRHAPDAPVGFEVVLQNERPFDPLAEPGPVAEAVAALRGLGATTLNVRFVHHSPAHYREQLAAMTEVVATIGE